LIRAQSLWDGLSRQKLPASGSVEQVRLPCPSCGRLSQVYADATKFVCPYCDAYFDLERCRHCGSPIQVKLGQKRGLCPWCGLLHKRRTLDTPTAAEMGAQLERQGVALETDDPDRRILTGCTVIGGYGHEMTAGSRINLRFEADGIHLVVPAGETSVISYDSVRSLDIEGRGVIRSGGGFMGGGFGAKGAVEGMLVASVLNSMTSKTQIETIISLRTRDWQLFLFWGQEPPDVLRRALAPVFGRLEAAREETAAQAMPSANSLASELAKLDELHRSGALSSEEFQAAKRRMIEGT
jgi:predicted RNA-binding Zn-ribbon protein involved in translation (DUF1610 family)